MNQGELTVRQIADGVGIHFSAVSRCLKNPPAVSKETYIKIAEFLGNDKEAAGNEWTDAKIKQLRKRENKKYGSVLESKGDRA